jgi:hypothetical protein
MISLPLARRLRDGGLTWSPAPGDRFVVADRGMDDEVFVLSNMTVNAHRLPNGAEIIAFNGTTEWALDSIQQNQSVWLPREDQLRALLAGAFRRLERGATGWRVVVEVAGRTRQAEHADAEEAYGLALLHLVTGEATAA